MRLFASLMKADDEDESELSRMTQELYKNLPYADQYRAYPFSPGAITPDALVDKRFVISSTDANNKPFAIACCALTAHRTYNLHGCDVEAHLVDLAVHPDYRRKGYGISVVTQAIEYCKSMYYKELYWKAYIENLPSAHLALRMGFKLVPRQCSDKFNVFKLKLTQTTEKEF